MGNPNTFDVKEKQMTFSDYYNNIPMYERNSFVVKLMTECEVSQATVYNWSINKFKPQKASHYRILSEITGIPAENLFPND